ncbi:hypothetical protein EUX98_g3831 [Antrodiella citrinella]|uniref:RNA-dependent RNA polymerase n=1 Tax=Antrodiella citrinella TaxID=2447956 RepID=A0A4S4MVK2_9APHY|nr:hypothetical protein EUX98_g3831 [Antrodiella citrinella]
MEIFMENISVTATSALIKNAVAHIIHSSDYSNFSTGPPLNLDVDILPRARNDGSRVGRLTLPSTEVGQYFLTEYGGLYPRKDITIGSRRIRFNKSERRADAKRLAHIRRYPYNPVAGEDSAAVSPDAESHHVAVSALQFGWECRDNVFSIEWEIHCGDSGRLTLDQSRRELRIQVPESPETENSRIIAIRASQITWASAGIDNEVPVINITLDYAPMFLSQKPENAEKGGAILVGGIERESGEVTSVAGGVPPREEGKLGEAPAPAVADAASDPVLYATPGGSRGASLPVTITGAESVAVTESATQPGQIETRDTAASESSSIFRLDSEDLEFDVALAVKFVEDFMRSKKHGSNGVPSRRRHNTLDSAHARVVAYTSHAMRLVCQHHDDLSAFRKLCHAIHVGVDDSFLYPAVRRGLFSEDVQGQYEDWVCQLAWPVAFQVEALTRNLLFDLREVMIFRDVVNDMSRSPRKGTVYTATFLRYLATQAKNLWSDEGTLGNIDDATHLVEHLLSDCVRKFSPLAPQTFPDNFQCLHVIVTPTAIRMEGPYPERSNRVIRLFQANADSFLRVSFVDENGLAYSFDRLDIAGRHFDFLAYSQSALKEHAVWFVKPFEGPDGNIVTAAPIIGGLGTFDHVQSDPGLIYCPARYGARISQAFTATDASIIIDPGEIVFIDDIYDRQKEWCFTDGVGTVSRDLAQDIWGALNKKQKHRNLKPCPSAFQIRFMGSKGVVSIDDTLTGRVICLRPSMIKFEAPNSREIEVARAFDRSSPFYLNRPLIMVLEGLDVPFETIQALQDHAVASVRGSTESLPHAARFMETYGLGASYQLPSVMLSLSLLGLDSVLQDPFSDDMMTFAIYHVLRELKHHARILVPNAWNLLGIADTSGYLQEGQILAHVRTQQNESIYLEGPTMVSRSPIIHRGDVQIAHAIGKPPADSPFSSETFPHCVVFSTKVDYPKTGQPVALDKLPFPDIKKKPDWDAPETMDAADENEYYQSTSYIGRLYRRIDLRVPTLPTAKRARRQQFAEMTVDKILQAFKNDDQDDEEGGDPIRNTLERHVRDTCSIELELGQHDDDLVREIGGLFSVYRSRLQSICADNTLSRHRWAMLSEEEAVMGIIVAKCSQPRRRQGLISKLREQTAALVGSVRHQLEGERGPERSLERAWVALRISLLVDQGYFGAKSFGWLALREVFNAITVINGKD